ncbi:MAG: chromosome segregation protein SMC [Clostridiales Family XIII bacterium]|jgi:chromosome segregation protein|nr:chromosome segregation protein SMC [Clostridiales Family XIII bacterium]
MYLKRVEIQGFKSFADPVVINFKEGVTCIIGPNGSGKSNISDAMRWVLGEQSAKMLRGGRMEEIIFAGTESRRSKGMAEVTIVLDNAAGILPIDYSEVAIKRRLFRSGESEYFINNSQCRLRDIKELIVDTGIGVDGYSFIGQGRVDKIISDRPETRREIFEEAAGIIKYKSRRAEAQRKLDSAQTGLDRVSDIISDIESRIGGLKEESEKAREHATLSERYRGLEINITLKNIENLQEKNKELKAQYEEAAGRIESRRGSRTAADEELSALRRRDNELELSATDLRERIAGNTARTLSIQSDALLNEEKRRTAERDSERLAAETSSLTEKIAEAEARAKILSGSDTASGEKLIALKSELEEKLTLAQTAASEVAAASSAIEERRSLVFDLSRERSVKETELQGNEELASNFEDAKRRTEAELSAASEEIASLETARTDVSAGKETFEKQASELADSQQSLRGSYEAANREMSDARQALERIRIESEQLIARRKTIEEMESNYEGYTAGVGALMKAGLPGVTGAVAGLIEVSPGYETAIETALGPALQYVVCSDDASAKRAIAWLKENKAGRVTFLPLSSIVPRDRNGAASVGSAPGFDAFASDRIKYEAAYENVIAYLLGGVAIAKDLDSAVSLAKSGGRYRFVTKEGDVVNPSGSLTGGAYRNKTANLLERRAEISVLADKIATLAAAHDRSVKTVDDLAEKSKRYLEELQTVDRRIREKEAELAGAAGELKSIEYRLTEQKERKERRARELRNAEDDKARSAEMNNALRAEIEMLASRVSDLEAGAAGESAIYEEAVTAAALAQETVTGIRMKVAAADAERAAADENAARAESELLSLRRDLQTKRAELSEAQALRLSPDEGGDISEIIRGMEEEKREFETELESVLSERREVRQKIEEKEYALMGISEDLEREIEQRNAMEVELGRQDTRISNWKEKLFEEFELSYVHALDYRREDFVMSKAVSENREIKARLRELGEVNPGSIREYDETKERYDFLTEQRDDILGSMSDYHKIVGDMDKISKERFCESFDAVACNFDETFKLLFGGGKGEVRLEDENDPLESGIIISVRPPGKTSLVNIDSYSGGEKSMVAIALMFAILKAKPSPFCILDEIDAALDETNIHRFANYITGFKETQFTLVTHQRSTMEYADALFGVTMQEQGITTILSLLLGDQSTEDFADALGEN